KDGYRKYTMFIDAARYVELAVHYLNNATFNTTVKKSYGNVELRYSKSHYWSVPIEVRTTHDDKAKSEGEGDSITRKGKIGDMFDPECADERELLIAARYPDAEFYRRIYKFNQTNDTDYFEEEFNLKFRFGGP